MSATDDLALPLLFVWGIPAYLLAGYVGILQFKVVYSLLISAMTSRGGGQLWKTVKKYISPVTSGLEAALGPPHKLTPNLTHILLAALLLAILVSSERTLVRSRARR